MPSIFLSVFLATTLAGSPQERPSIESDSAPVAVPEPSARAMAYYRGGNVIWIVRAVLALAVPSVVLFTGLSVRMRNLAQRVGRRWLLVIVVYFALYWLLDGLVHLPLSYYAGFVRQHAYGLSNQSFARWLRDVLLTWSLGLVFGVLVVWFPYWLMRRSPRRWWLYASLAALPVMFFVMFVEPIWIAPLYNHFGPLHDKRLEAEILDTAWQAGIDGGRVFEVDKSADTKAVNAYVTGFLGSKRIVLWDTLLQRLDARQVRVVMAHEMGHYVLGHVVQGLLAGFCGVLVALFLVHHAAHAMLRRYGRLFGFTQLSDIASLPLLVLLLQVIALLMMPIGLAFSRHIEHEADRFALELTHDNHAAATAFVRLQEENLSNPRPGPLYTFWRASHPSLAERIEFANDYRPWECGEPLRYGYLFRVPRGSSSIRGGEL